MVATLLIDYPKNASLVSSSYCHTDKDCILTTGTLTGNIRNQLKFDFTRNSTFLPVTYFTKLCTDWLRTISNYLHHHSIVSTHTSILIALGSVQKLSEGDYDSGHKNGSDMCHLMQCLSCCLVHTVWQVVLRYAHLKSGNVCLCHAFAKLCLQKKSHDCQVLDVVHFLVLCSGRVRL